MITRWPPDRGFTLIELVSIMVVIGVLAVVAIPKLNSSAFQERGFRDGVFTTLTHARRVAMASRRFVCVSIVSGTGSGATASMTRDNGDTTPETATAATAINCTQNVALPSPMSRCASTNQVCAPSGVSLGCGTCVTIAPGIFGVIFDPQGRSISTPTVTASAQASITISNQPPVTVATETGYVQ
jgi:MSHA pilin protein MshC